MKKSTPLLALALLLAASGCAPKNWNTEEDGAFDPLEGINRETHKLNKGLDFLILKPAAKTYRFLVPDPLQAGVDNVINNLGEPANIANNALQKKGTAAIQSTARFAFNTVLGIGGLFDVASKMDLPRQEADLGQTLRGYGMKDTMYIVLPLLGPTTVADGIGFGGDSLLSPQQHIDDEATQKGVAGVSVVHIRASLLDETELADEIALDEYLFIRDAYEERRLSRVPTDLWGQ